MRLLRFSQRSSVIIDRSESFYTVLESNDALLKAGFQLLHGVPIEVMKASNKSLILCYSFQASQLMETGQFTISDMKNVLISHPTLEYLQSLQLCPESIQKCPEFQYIKRNIPSKQEPQSRRDINQLLGQEMASNLDNPMLLKLHRMYHQYKPVSAELQNFDIKFVDSELKTDSILMQRAGNFLSVFVPHDQLKWLFRLGTVVGAREKRYACYQNKTLDLVEWLQIKEIEKLIYRFPATPRLRAKKILATKELKKWLMTGQQLQDVEFFSTRKKVEPEKNIGLVGEFLALKFSNETQGNKLFCMKDGTMIGLAAKGEEPVTVVL